MEDPKHTLVISGSYLSLDEASADIHRHIDSFLEYYGISPEELKIASIKQWKIQANPLGNHHRIIVQVPYWYEKKLPWPPKK